MRSARLRAISGGRLETEAGMAVSIQSHPTGPRRPAPRPRRVLEWALFGGLSVALLLWPAVCNRFPIVFYDTGGYIAAPHIDPLQPGRGVAYGLFLTVFQGGTDWWPAIAAQAVACVWLIHLVARVHRLPSGPRALVLTVGLLAAATSLPFFTAQLMPDWLGAALVLVLYLLAFQAERLARWERFGLAALGAFGIAVHMSHVALAVGLLPVIAAAAGMHRAHIRLPALMVAMGIALVPLTNAVPTGRPALTPGGETFVFGRLVQDGIVARFLADHCPSSDLQLCAYKDVLPATADEWIWAGSSPFHAVGGWEGGADEMRRITIASLEAYPLEHLARAGASGWSQFWSFRTGDGLADNEYWHAAYVIETFYPEALAGFAAARQQADGPGFAAINAFHAPVIFASLALMVPALLWAPLRRERELRELCAFVLLALLGNAVICGILSNPHDRYQSRLVWLAFFCTILAARHLVHRARSRAWQSALT